MARAGKIHKVNEYLRQRDDSHLEGGMVDHHTTQNGAHNLKPIN